MLFWPSEVPGAGESRSQSVTGSAGAMECDMTGAQVRGTLLHKMSSLNFNSEVFSNAVSWPQLNVQNASNGTAL